MEKNGKIIGYTTGVFDLFHIGHLRILQRGREHCDHLIVGVTTDRLCVERKQKTPVVPQWERMEIVRAMRCVDEVVEQDSMDKMLAWETYRFDVMFVGDDWKGTPQWIELEKKFARVDVSIVYFSYTGHTSSTLLRQALLDHLEVKSRESHG